MLSFGLSEIALVVVVVVIVIGPKELPNLLRQLGSFSKSLKKASRQFKNSLNELSEEGDLKDIKKSFSEFKDIKNDLDPTKNIKEELSSIKETVIFTDKEISNINNKIKKD
tara:strand:- start:253 stop:585 length:333 start_codon:yes stop_codon:yes gene_type:complete